MTNEKKPVSKVSLFLPVAVGVLALVALVLVVLPPNPKAKPSGTNRSPDAVATPPSAAAAATPAPVQPILVPQSEVYAQYAGSQTCISCHGAAHQTWKNSHHGLAERPLNPAVDGDAFAPERAMGPGMKGMAVAAAADGAGYEIRSAIEGPAGVARVDRVIGESPLRQYLVATTGGRYQTHEATYDPHNREWFNVFGTEDRKPGEWGHWTGRGMNWNTMCAGCHNTRVRKNYDVERDIFATAMAEQTVSCEACHGPMKAHVTWAEKAKAEPAYAASDASAAPPVPKVEPSRVLDTCGSCHARRSELTGDFIPGEPFFDHYSLAIPDDSDLYYPDGQVRDEDYEFAAFMGSRMHGSGVTCVHCHDPHAAQPRVRGNDLCMTCHNGSFAKAPIIQPTAHSFHGADSAGNQCVSCHMPVTVYMQRHPRHDHGFTIPDPWLTQKHGVPNACNRCHQDKDAAWAQAATEKWYGTKMDRPSRHRADAIARARKGDATARQQLLALLDGQESGYWKAVALELLPRWSNEESVSRAALKALSDPHPMVRERAVDALDDLVAAGDARAIQAVTQRLEDPSRVVRVAAAWSLRRTINPQVRAGRELLYNMDINADQPTGIIRKGAWHLARNELPQSLRAYKTAVEWDPNSAPLRHELGVVMSVSNDTVGALAQMQEAVKLDPSNAEYHYKLALALNEGGQREAVIAAFEKAVALDPAHARAWYNLGLAKFGARDVDGALKALNQAEAAEPRDPQFPYAAATIYMQINDHENARLKALRSLEIAPQFREAASLLQALGGR